MRITLARATTMALLFFAELVQGAEAPAYLRVKDLSFALQPQNQTVTVGQSVTFGVTTLGQAPLVYQWTFNGVNVGANTNYYTRTNSKFADDGAQVRVSVSNVLGAILSRPATLSVRPIGTNYYVAANGATSNSGLSTNSPWPLSYGITKLGPGITLTLMPGVYSDPVLIYSVSGTALNPATVRSQYKWQAVIANSTNRGIEVWSARYIVLDGLCVSNATSTGIKLMDSNNTVRNCWVTGNGNLGAGSGIDSSSELNSDNLIEYNLIELDDSHGVYLSGPNNIVRGNVIRNNKGWGMQVYTEYVGMRQHNNYVYNNLVYGNTNAYGVGIFGADGNGSLPGTNYCFNNTILGGIQLAYGTVRITNNIILPALINPTRPIYTYVAATITADYNLGTTTINPSGAHNVITNVAVATMFVNPVKGLYWLSAASPARNKTKTDVFGPVDFFGNAQSSVGDIGAFQYSATLVGDIRVLNPGSANPDYWSLP